MLAWLVVEGRLFTCVCESVGNWHLLSEDA